MSPAGRTERRKAHVPTFDDLKQSCADDWRAYIQHAFIRDLGAGTLARDAFRHYLEQDYLFLVHFARAYGLAVYKSRDIADLRRALASLKAIVDVEMGLHIKYCASWGISEADLMVLPEARATMAYTRYVLDAGNRGDLLDLHVALAPCLIGYAEIATWLSEQPFTVREGNPYASWIAMYASEDFQTAAAGEKAWLDAELAGVTAKRFDALAATFRDATRLEIDFWQMGLDRRF